jgi:hypothetical protein
VCRFDVHAVSAVGGGRLLSMCQTAEKFQVQWRSAGGVQKTAFRVADVSLESRLGWFGGVLQEYMQVRRVVGWRIDTFTSGLGS